MFWKIVEFLVRIVFFKRFSQAKKIGAAVEIAGQGKIDRALLALAKIEPKLHPVLSSVFHLTKGRILISADRLDEAKVATQTALSYDSDNPKIKLDLAMIAGRQFQYDVARKYLAEIKSLPDDPDNPTTKVKGDADNLLDQLDKIESGDLEIEYRSRAEAFAAKPIGPANKPAGLPADFALLDLWIAKDPEAARKFADEIALLIGHTALSESGTSARVGLSIEDFTILKDGAPYICPFEITARRFASEDAKLSDLLKK